MIESEFSKSSTTKSPLQEYWPPKWFFSYSDLATLMMTFFIVLATMLSLKIPLYVLADKRLQIIMKERILRLEELRRLTEKERDILKEFEEMEEEQVYSVIDLGKMKEFANQIRTYIKEKNLEEFIIVEEGKWKVKITPAAPFLFDKGKDTLKADVLSIIDMIADFLKKYPSNIKIEGHTDNIPIHNRRFASNWELSVARSNSIMKYLIAKHKIPVKRIEAIGYGEYRPVVPNDSEANRAKNRRVVFEITPIIERETP